MTNKKISKKTTNNKAHINIVNDSLIPSLAFRAILGPKYAFNDEPSEYTLSSLPSDNEDISISQSLEHVKEFKDEPSIYNYDETDNEDDHASSDPYILQSNYADTPEVKN